MYASAVRLVVLKFLVSWAVRASSTSPYVFQNHLVLFLYVWHYSVCGFATIAKVVLQASADVLAMAALEVDLSTIKEGNCLTVKWRGKPVFVKHRTDAEVAREQAVPLADLRDPETDEARTQDPKVRAMLSTFFACFPAVVFTTERLDLCRAPISPVGTTLISEYRTGKAVGHNFSVLEVRLLGI